MNSAELVAFKKTNLKQVTSVNLTSLYTRNAMEDEENGPHIEITLS